MRHGERPEAPTRTQLVGTRLALVGALLYLSEWLVIPFAPDLPTDDLGEGSASIAAAYAGHGTDLAFLAGYLSFALIGRVVFVSALRSALPDSRRERVLTEIALAAMVVSVAIEIVQLGLTAAAGWLAEADASVDAVVALDAAATVLFTLIVAAIGTSVLTASWAMLVSGLFARWLCWLGVVAGALIVVGVHRLGLLGLDGDLRAATAAPCALLPQRPSSRIRPHRATTTSPEPPVTDNRRVVRNRIVTAGSAGQCRWPR